MASVPGIAGHRLPIPRQNDCSYGRICLGKKKINFSTVFAGQAVGIKEVQDDIWLVSFMDYDLGYFDLEPRVLEPLCDQVLSSATRVWGYARNAVAGSTQ
jgi:hypothetical protein